MESSKKTFLIMKLAAVALLAGVLTILFFHSNDPGFNWTQKGNTSIQDLGPASGRTATLDFPILKDLRGSVVHLNFWAQWCEPCLRELPILESLQNEFSGKYRIVLINLDQDAANIEKARQLQTRLAPNLTTIYENTKILEEKAQVQALPYHILVDKQGFTARTFFGDLEKQLEDFKIQLHQLFAEGVPAN
jgi:thiol-disulfide isomerase/thioredoxin